MNAPLQITATVGAYLTDPTSDYRGMDSYLDMLKDPEQHQSLIGTLLSYAAQDMSKHWTRVGEADITVTLLSPDEQVHAAIKALNGQLEKARADFMAKQADIMERISKLQALEYTPAEAA